MKQMTLYMPIHAELFTCDEYGSNQEEPERVSAHEATDYADSILAGLVRCRMPEEAERGLMHWYDQEDEVDAKVRRAEFSIEERDGQLWGTVECLVDGDLTPDELEDFKSYITGQAADGWGESFEQREIKVPEGELFVHLWDMGDDWSVMTEDEFSRRHEQPQEPQLGGHSF